MLVVMNPRKYRIEVGYGLEGILNDAKVGDIGRTMVPAAQSGRLQHCDSSGRAADRQVIATDAGVTLNLAQPVHQYHRQQAPGPAQPDGDSSWAAASFC